MTTSDEVSAQFTRSDGRYVFARWGRPIAPVVFGVADATIAVVKGAIQAVTALADHPMAETDPELGVNMMMFFLKDWNELRDVPDLDRMIEGLGPLLAKLEATGANQYRVFRFDEAGAIRAAFVFVRMDAHMTALPAETIAMAQAVQTILLWSDTAFTDRSALAELPDGGVIVRPDVGALIRAAYDPVLPDMADDKSHALRVAARMVPVQ